MDLEPVDRITTDAVGEPGQRIFYLQARKGPDLVTILVEKQQVELLSSSILEILARVGKETAQGPPEEEMELEEPVEPLWRAGRLSIGYLEERDWNQFRERRLGENSLRAYRLGGEGDVTERNFLWKSGKSLPNVRIA